MALFRVLVGNFEIVGTTGAADGRRPAAKSDAVAFDVIDRRATGNTQFVTRDQQFEDAWDICTLRISIRAAKKPH